MKKLFSLASLLFIFSAASYGQCSVSVTTSNHDTAGCAPFSVNLSAHIPGGKTAKSYHWDFGDGNSSSSASPGYSYSNRGRFNPTVTITYADNSTCKAESDTAVRVYGDPQIGIINVSNWFPIGCLTGNSFSFTRTSLPSADSFPIVNYLWNFGNGDTSTDSGPVVRSYTTLGDHFFSLTVIDSKGCSSSKTDSVRILGSINSFTPLDSIGCAPFTVPIRVHDRNGINYVWHLGDGTTSTFDNNDVQDSLVSITYNNAGTYYLYVEETDTTYVPLYGFRMTCTTTWPDTALHSHPLFKIVVQPRGPVDIVGDSIVCLDMIAVFRDTTKDTGYNRFVWDFGNGQIDSFFNKGGKDSTGKYDKTEYSQYGYNWVKLTAFNTYGCDSIDSFKVRVSECLSIQKAVANPLNISAYPNPFDDITQINYSLQNATHVSVAVYDLYGKQLAILQYNFMEAGNYSLPFDANKYSLTAGAYYVKIITDNTTATEKIILLK